MFINGEVGEEHVVLGTEAEALSGLTHLSADGVTVDASMTARGRIHSWKGRGWYLYSVEIC